MKKLKLFSIFAVMAFCLAGLTACGGGNNNAPANSGNNPGGSTPAGSTPASSTPASSLDRVSMEPTRCWRWPTCPSIRPMSCFVS